MYLTQSIQDLSCVHCSNSKYNQKSRNYTFTLIQDTKNEKQLKEDNLDPSIEDHTDTIVWGGDG